ncbi:hypothetical protein D9M68_902540 [compost metagenome]
MAEPEIAQIHLLGANTFEALAQQAGITGEGFQARIAKLHQLGNVLVVTDELGQALAEDHQFVAGLAVFGALHVGILHILLIVLVVRRFPGLLPLIDGVIQRLELAVEAVGGRLSQ